MMTLHDARATSRRGLTRRRLCMGLVPATLGLPAALAGCVSTPEKIGAIEAVNTGFRLEYERILAELGTRRVDLPRRDALLALRVALAGLGLHTEAQDIALGLLVSAGPAPRPLTQAEWAQASALDTPFLRRLIEPHVGIAANFVQFEPQGLDVLISATVIAQGSGSEVALTVRLRETAPPRSGWPRREYVGPNLLRTGLATIWAAYEREVRASVTRP
jgi:hypothetical protein